MRSLILQQLDNTISILDKWLCCRKTTKPVQGQPPKSDDLAEFRQFHFVSAVVSAMCEHL